MSWPSWNSSPFFHRKKNTGTLPETNSEFTPENRPCQKETIVLHRIPTIHFQVQTVSFRYTKEPLQWVWVRLWFSRPHRLPQQLMPIVFISAVPFFSARPWYTHTYVYIYTNIYTYIIIYIYIYAYIHINIMPRKYPKITVWHESIKLVQDSVHHLEPSKGLSSPSTQSTERGGVRQSGNSVAEIRPILYTLALASPWSWAGKKCFQKFSVSIVIVIIIDIVLSYGANSRPMLYSKYFNIKIAWMMNLR